MTHLPITDDTKELDEITRVAPQSHALLASTELSTGKPGLLVDIGSIGNLGGDKWARSVTQQCGPRGMGHVVEKRPKPLKVHGVGSTPSEARENITLPIGIRDTDGNATLCNAEMPVIANSSIPGLLGITSLRQRKSIIDLNDGKLYFVGPGDYDLAQALPPGTECYQCETSPSGHLLLPCCDYEGAKSAPMTLHATSSGADDPPVGGESCPSSSSAQ